MKEQHNDSSCTAGLHFLDGTETSQAYAVIARKQDFFLGLRFLGFEDGAEFGVPGKTYVRIRLRSSRSQKLMDEIGMQTYGGKVVSLVPAHIGPADVWPDFAFENISSQRASVAVGMFIPGCLETDPERVLARLRKGDVFEKLVSYTADRVGAENIIASTAAIAAWLAEQAGPWIRDVRKKLIVRQAMKATQQEFQALIETQPEAVGPYKRQLRGIFERHVQHFLLGLAKAELVSKSAGDPDHPGCS